MTKRQLLLSAAVLALMIGGTSPASAQYFRDYKPNDKPNVEVDMGVLDGNPVSEVEEAPLQPIAPLPRIVEPAPMTRPAPAPLHASNRVLKPSAPQPEMAEMPAPQPAKPYRPYLTTPVAKPAPAPQVAAEEVPAPQPIRSYPPAPTPKTIEWEVPAPLPQPVPKPVVAKKYEPSPSVVDDASYKPDYSGYYKSGASVPKAIAAIEPKQEPVVAVAPAPKKDIAEQLTEELAPPPPLEKTAAVEPSKHVAEELTEQLPPPKLDPLPEIATERSIEQTPPPAARMEPIISKPVAQAEYKPQPAPASTTKIVSMPPQSTRPGPAAAPARQSERTPSRIISYPDSTVITRPSGQPVASAPVLTPEPSFIPAVTPAEAPEQKIVSAPAPAPTFATTSASAQRPSLEILTTPAPEKPVEKPVQTIDGETAEAIVPPSKEAGKADIAKLAEEVDKAAADMGTAPTLTDPPKFASVPTHSDLMLEFPGNSSDLTAGTQRKLDAIVRQMEDLVDGGRLQVRGYAAGEDGSKSSARRIALSRALSVRSYLMDKGVKAKRVDVRAMGSETDRNPLDRVDLIFQR